MILVWFYSAYCGGMWLAVLRMILEMGDILGEKADMDKYRAILDKGKKSYQTKLWNGKGIFRAPEPKAQVHYCDRALSVVRLSSVRRPSSLTFHIFDFSSETAKQNSTKLHRKQDLNVLYQVCVFRADRKNKMAALASDWLRHFQLLLWNRWTEFNETW